MQSKEIVKHSLVDRLHEVAKKTESDQAQANHYALMAFNGIREYGLLLPNDWKQTQMELPWGAQRSSAAFAFARKNPERLEDLRVAARSMEEACMVTGFLQFPEGHGPQQLHSPNFFSILSKHLVSMRSDMRKAISRSPVDQWDMPSVEQFVHQLEPALDEINAIYASAKARLFEGPS